MKMFKKILGLSMAVVLALSAAACSSGDKNVSRQPHQQQDLSIYSETEIGSNSGLKWPTGSRVNANNQLVVYDRAEAGFITLDSDGNPTGDAKVSFAGLVTAFDLDAQGNIYVVTGPMGENNAGQSLTVLSPQGDTLKTVELEPIEAKADNMMGRGGYSDIAVDSNGSIYLANPAAGNIHVLDKDGKPGKPIGSQGFESIDIDSKGNIVAGNFMGERIIEKFEASSGKSLWSVDLSTQASGAMYTMGSNKIRTAQADDSIYSISSQGITKYDSSGKLIGTAVDFASHTILASGNSITDMTMDASGNIYVTTSPVPVGGGMKTKGGPKTVTGGETSGQPVKKGEGNGAGQSVIMGPDGAARGIDFEIYRYSVQTGEAKKQEVITISVPASNRALEMAAGVFQKEHPEYRIEIQTYPSQDNTGSDYETYVKNLNTQILSGNGPDIISVAGLPFENYASKNILVDIGNLMENDKTFNKSNYYSNIFEALKYKGTLYVLPTDFTFDVIMANRAILDQEGIKIDDSRWTWNDFRDIAEKVSRKDGGNSRAALPSVSGLELLNLFTGGSFSNYITDDGAKFTSQGFIDLLNTVKAFTDSGLTDNNIQPDMASILDAAGRNALVFYPNTVTDYSMYSFMKAAFKEQLSLYNIPGDGSATGGTFTSNSLYSINNNSHYKAQSWEFLKTLVSDEVQSQVMNGAVQTQNKSGNASPATQKGFGGFSINRTAQQAKAQLAIDMSNGGGKMKMMMKGPNGSVELSPGEMTQADIDAINNYIAGLNKYADTDSNISAIVADETKAFFSGDKSAEESAKLIQDRAATYLGE